MSLLFWSLFQTGASEDTSVADSVQLLTCVPYTTSDPEMYFSVARLMEDPNVVSSSDTQSHYLSGCIENLEKLLIVTDYFRDCPHENNKKILKSKAIEFEKFYNCFDGTHIEKRYTTSENFKKNKESIEKWKREVDKFNKNNK